MLKAIIFDFDGVIADTEPIHLEAFKIILKEKGLVLTDKDYYEKYLAYDDKTLFKYFLLENGVTAGPELISELIDNKHTVVKNLFNTHVELFPGVYDFIDLIHSTYVCSIASGALLAEIEPILYRFNLNSFFHSITSADEVIKCKPDPEPFIKALGKINTGSVTQISEAECLVFEDSVHGVEAAKSAGMKCIGITNSYEPEYLKKADLVVGSFNDVDVKSIKKLFN